MIGIDIASIDRINKMYEKFGEKAYERFLDEEEIALIKKAETAAGFWAVKEAASKAIGTGIGKECSFYDIKISKTKKGAVKVKYSKAIKKKFKIKKAFASITHDQGLAVAVVYLTKK